MPFSTLPKAFRAACWRVVILEPISHQGGVDAHQLAGAVVVGPEDRGLLPVPEQDPGGVGAPHLVRHGGGDRAVVNPLAEFAAWPPWGLKAVFTHQVPDPLAIGADPRMARPGMDLR